MKKLQSTGESREKQNNEHNQDSRSNLEAPSMYALKHRRSPVTAPVSGLHNTPDVLRTNRNYLTLVSHEEAKPQEYRRPQTMKLEWYVGPEISDR